MPGEPVTADAVIAEARAWLGVPWRHQGRDRAGIDCGGLVIRIGQALGLTSYDVTGYARRAKDFEFLQHFRDGLGMQSVRMAEMRPGDILIFVDGRNPCHSGVLTWLHDCSHFVHAHAVRRKVVEEPYAGEWRDAARFVFRWPQVRV
jgi:cell wall-associated NlpC family hydrolase